MPVNRLVFLDESGMSITMSGTHAWVKRGQEYIDRVPMNRGKNLTLLGAIGYAGWVTLNSIFDTANANRFVAWLTKKLLPKLQRNDVLVMDNLNAHHDCRVVPACAARGVRVIYQPPHSPDFNGIERGWLRLQNRICSWIPALRAATSPSLFGVAPRRRRGLRLWFFR